MRKQYHLRRAGDGFDAWDVDRLIALSAALPIVRVPVESIAELDAPYWFDDSDETPTVRSVVEHCRLIAEVDTGYPIILDHEGRVTDGMHRVARALLEGRGEIDAVRLPAPIDPDFRHCAPGELPY